MPISLPSKSIAHFHNSQLSAPDRFSRKEAARCTRKAIALGRPLRQEEIGEQIRPHRLAKLKPVCNGREAAWALCTPPHKVRELIAAGKLPARRVDDAPGRWHWEILAADVARAAEELA